MKITVGGSFHEPVWSKVVETANILRNSGHIILAPGEEWTPINLKDDFVRFKGEEYMSAVDLQKGFLDAMKQSDAYVIVDYNGYIGQTVSAEFGYAAAFALSHSRMGKD